MHDKQVTELSETIAALTTESQGLATEAQEEASRADTAEDALAELTQTAGQRQDQIDALHRNVAKMADVEAQLKDEIAAKDDADRHAIASACAAACATCRPPSSATRSACRRTDRAYFAAPAS